MDWMIKRLIIPGEIKHFIEEVFEIYEIRGLVGKENGISFVVHSNEHNHSIPHVHAKYGKYEISIAIESGEVLAGNLPRKNQKIAREWVLTNQTKLLSDWNNYSMSAISNLTKSMIGAD